MKDWKEYNLIDVVDPERGICYGVVQPGNHDPNGIPVIKIFNITENNFSEKGLLKVSQAIENKHKRSRLKGGEILLTLVGTLGETFIVPNNFKGFNVVRAIGIIPVSDEFDRDWIYWQINSPDLQNAFRKFATTTVQATLNIKQLETIPVLYPKESIRTNTVGLLNSLRNKIANLKLINTKLASLSNLIFSDYFLLNNAKFHDGNFGKIIIELTKKISTNEQNDYKVLSAVNTSQLIPSEDYFTKQVYSKDLSKYKMLEQFDFAYNPARVNIGSLGMLDRPIKGCVSPVYIAFRANPNWHYFVDLMIKQPHIRKTIEVYCSGSVRQVLRFEDFCRIEIKLPEEKKVLEFNGVYQSILNKVNHNKQQIEKLTTLLESILPRLMTGKIEMKN